MSQLKGDNPFEEYALPKSFYFPSLEKPLSMNQRKTCLSPNKMEGNPKLAQSKEDVKFLSGSNQLSTHQVPTREDGTLKHDSSSGSQFDESWPSTDKNVSSLSNCTPPSSTTPAESRTFNKESRGAELPGEDIHKMKISNQSTLSKYVERFRHGAPVSREHRGNVHSTNIEDFWWLSPPSSTSTPNQPTESTVSSKYSLSSTTEISPKSRRKKTSLGSAPLQFVSRPVRQLVDAMDSDTDDLQTRAELLLEKSENTLSDVSTPESIPKRPSSWMLQKQRRQDLKDEPRIPVTRPAPEDDILYQWRLSRRLEKAQEQVKSSSWTKPFSDVAPHRSAVTPPSHVSEVAEEREKANEIRRTMNAPETTGYGVSSMLKTETAPKTLNSINDDGRNTEANGKRKDCVLRIGSPVNENNDVQNAPLETDVPAVCFIGDTNLPPHVHMMCDIVPCVQKKECLEPRGYCTVRPKERPCSAPAVSDSTRTTGLKTVEQVKMSEIIDKQELDEHLSIPPSPIVNKCDLSESDLPPEVNYDNRYKIKKTNDTCTSQTLLDGKMTVNDCQEADNGNMIGAVIGQVISERLFSCTSSSRLSSPSNSISIECTHEEEEKKKLFEQKNVDVKENAKLELKECSRHDKQLYSTAINSTLTFSNDEILIRLRQQADIYQEHLRNIDALLETLAD